MTKRKYSDEDLINAVKSAKSYREVGRILGFINCASHVHKRIDELKLDTSHFINLSEKGKSKFVEWIDKRFGKLLVIDIIPPDKNETSQWKRKYKVHCKCDCGNHRIYLCSYFKKGFSHSCGCNLKGPYKEKLRLANPYKEIPGEYWSRILDRCSSRGLECNITIQWIWKLFEKQNKKCALSGLILTFGRGQQTASLDRIDNSKGYIKGNVQWIHKDINSMKSNFNESYFIETCRRIIEYVDLQKR